MKRQFWNLTTAQNEATIDIFGIIGDLDATEETTAAADFVRELRKLGRVKRLNVGIHSPGGSVWDGMAMYRALRDHPAEKVVRVDAVAASIASVVMLAGDEIHVGSEAVCMIHNPMGFCAGDERDFQSVIGRLKQAKQQILQIYERRTGGIVSELSKWMDAETWFHGSEIVDAGFADKVIADSGRRRQYGIAACAPELLKHYKHVPANLKRNTKPAPVDADTAARLKRLGIIP